MGLPKFGDIIYDYLDKEVTGKKKRLAGKSSLK